MRDVKKGRDPLGEKKRVFWQINIIRINKWCYKNISVH